ncbi:MAG TPA: hypothetical protein PLE32_04480, partial [Haliscomenobacter sp.]|nr:hypothetical protein [Haliscomenobacter sp.]
HAHQWWLCNCGTGDYGGHFRFVEIKIPRRFRKSAQIFLKDHMICGNLRNLREKKLNSYFLYAKPGHK